MSAPFLHVVVSSEPPTGGRPRAQLVPTMSAGAMLARARSARTVSDLFGLFRAHIHPTHAGEKWRKAAAHELSIARRRVFGSRPLAGAGDPIEIFLLIVFALAASKHRKREPLARSWAVSRNLGDFDNLAKPVCDAANDELWPDDSQVARACVEKVVGAQGERPRVELLARRLVGSPYDTLFGAVEAGRGWTQDSPGAAGALQETLWQGEVQAERPTEAAGGPRLPW